MIIEADKFKKDDDLLMKNLESRTKLENYIYNLKIYQHMIILIKRQKN